MEKEISDKKLEDFQEALAKVKKEKEEVKDIADLQHQKLEDDEKCD
jgi:hypothetical protein